MDEEICFHKFVRNADGILVCNLCGHHMEIEKPERLEPLRDIAARTAKRLLCLHEFQYNDDGITETCTKCGQTHSITPRGKCPWCGLEFYRGDKCCARCSSWLQDGKGNRIRLSGLTKGTLELLFGIATRTSGYSDASSLGFQKLVGERVFYRAPASYQKATQDVVTTAPTGLSTDKMKPVDSGQMILTDKQFYYAGSTIRKSFPFTEIEGLEVCLPTRMKFAARLEGAPVKLARFSHLNLFMKNSPEVFSFRTNYPQIFWLYQIGIDSPEESVDLAKLELSFYFDDIEKALNLYMLTIQDSISFRESSNNESTANTLTIELGGKIDWEFDEGRFDARGSCLVNDEYFKFTYVNENIYLQDAPQSWTLDGTGRSASKEERNAAWQLFRSQTMSSILEEMRAKDILVPERFAGLFRRKNSQH